MFPALCLYILVFKNVDWKLKAQVFWNFKPEINKIEVEKYK